MDNFSIDSKSINYSGTGRGVAYIGDLMLNGRPVGRVANDGNGGDTHLVGKFGHRDELEAAVEAFETSSFEPESEFFNHLFDVAEGLA